MNYTNGEVSYTPNKRYKDNEERKNHEIRIKWEIDFDNPYQPKK